MSCRGRDGELSLMLTGDLDEAAARALAAHLEACEACASSLRALRRNAESLRELGAHAVPPEAVAALHRRLVEEVLPQAGPKGTSAPRHFRRAVIPLAAAACLLAAIGLGGLWLAAHRAGRGVTPAVQASRVLPPAPPAPRDISGTTSHGSTEVRPSPVAGHPPKTPNVELAARAPGPRPSAPSGKPTSLVVRLQTDDPGVVIYWQFHNTGG